MVVADPAKVPGNRNSCGVLNNAAGAGGRGELIGSEASPAARAHVRVFQDGRGLDVFDREPTRFLGVEGAVAGLAVELDDPGSVPRCGQ